MTASPMSLIQRRWWYSKRSIANHRNTYARCVAYVSGQIWWRRIETVMITLYMSIVRNIYYDITITIQLQRIWKFLNDEKVNFCIKICYVYDMFCSKLVKTIYLLISETKLTLIINLAIITDHWKFKLR